MRKNKLNLAKGWEEAEKSKRWSVQIQQFEYSNENT